jgi:hypothetical protein
LLRMCLINYKELVTLVLVIYCAEHIYTYENFDFYEEITLIEIRLGDEYPQNFLFYKKV